MLRCTPSGASNPLKKVTLRLHERVATAIRALVDAGTAGSADAFVEEAVIARFRELRKERVYAAYAAAAADDAFMADMAATNRAFDATVGDGLADPDR
jgi:Arc/MetJ-type ribon-helix-helix transcriptional regulator